MRDVNGVGRRWLAVTAVLLLFVRPALSVASLGSVQRVARIVARIGTLGTPTLRPEEVGNLVSSVASRIPGTKCLAMSVTAQALLKAQGHDSELRIGVQKWDEEFYAHAWVESNGRTIIGDEVDTSSYNVLETDVRSEVGEPNATKTTVDTPPPRLVSINSGELSRPAMFDIASYWCMGQIRSLADSEDSFASRCVDLIRSEQQFIRQLSAEARKTARQDGLLAVARGFPDAVQNLLSTTRRNFEILFVNPENASEPWKRRSGWYSPEYYAMAGPDGRSERVRNAIETRVGDDARILEIGCSSGRHLSHLHDHGYTDLHGVEINADAIEVMEKTFPDVAADATIYESSIQDVIGTFDDDEFDVVYAVSTLSLIPPTDDYVFDELQRVASDLIITIENEKEADTGPTRSVVQDFPVFFRDLRKVLTDDSWKLDETEELQFNTFRIFCSETG